MNARNKLKTIDLMRIDTHIVYHAQRIITEWGWGLFNPLFGYPYCIKVAS